MLAQASESVTVSSTARIIAATREVKSLAMHGGASSQTPNSPADSCVSTVLQASHQRVAGVENPCRRSRRTCERSAKFSHWWRRQRGAAAGIPTFSGRNRSRKCPENVKLFRYVVHEASETNFKKPVFKKNEN